MKELICVLKDNEIEMYIVCWGGRGKNITIKIQPSGRLRYDRFKQNLKSDNLIHSMLEALSDKTERNISSSLIN